MIYLVFCSLVLSNNLFSLISSQEITDLNTESVDYPITSVLENGNNSGEDIQLILILIVAIVLIITILVIVIIILFSLAGKRKKKREDKYLMNFRRKAGTENNSNMVFAANGQSDNERLQKDIESRENMLASQENYATAIQNTSASESGIYAQRPTDLRYDKNKPTVTSILIKDNKSKSKIEK